MAEIKITEENYDREISSSDIPVLLDFWATWCGPCMMLSPIIEEVANDFDGKIKVGKVNVDDEVSLAAKFGISSIPTLVLVKDGEVSKTSVGYMTKEELVSFIEE